MKKVLLAVIVIILFYFGARYFSTQLSYCLPQDLMPTVSFDAGAGNMYGTFVLKNITHKPCQITADNFIAVTYDKKAYPNIAVSHADKPEGQRFHLAPNQEVYSQVHFPNGPQCSSEIKTAEVKFVYAISPADKVTFVNQAGGKEQEITVCSAISDITTIEIWKLSSKPITP